LKEELNEKEKQVTDLTVLRDSLQEEVKNTKDKLEKTQESSKSKQTDLTESNKGELELILVCRSIGIQLGEVD